ncbi:MAG TPA: hypothetical protein VNZ45_13845 [Bacteroidia bacterium]|nr:hypothetical protein [Bacteroidia bacterium]
MAIPAVKEARSRIEIKVCKVCGCDIDTEMMDGCDYGCVFDNVSLEKRKGHIIVRVYERVDTLIEEREE